MTSPDRGESAKTVLAYSGGVIDRAATQRTEPGWVDATLARASTRLIPMWRDQCVVSGEPAVPVIVPAATAAAGAVLNSATEVVFLGLDDHGGIFAADLSQAGESAAAATAGGERVLDVRAGFVGVCESLEDAVRREVAEETGVPVGPVTYMASQGWPFPSGLMIGFRATALAQTVHVDGEEVIEARWFTRAELTEHARTAGRLGRQDSIDRYLLCSWLDDIT